jgi:hypothetical protein
MPVTKSNANGFVGRVGLANQNVTSYAGTAAYGSATRSLRRALNGSHGDRRAKATLLALTGAAVGAASKAYSNSRIDAGRTTGQAGVNLLGGKRTIETKVFQTGVTVAQDLTDFDTRLAASVRPTYPTVKGGGGGGRAGRLA